MKKTTSIILAVLLVVGLTNAGILTAVVQDGLSTDELRTLDAKAVTPK